jgi:hypothetical protein
MQRIPEENRSKGLKYYYRNRERLRELSRLRAKANYDSNPDKKLADNAEWRTKNKARHKVMKKAWTDRRFFYNKAMLIKAHKRGVISMESTNELAIGLMRQWIKQRGRCALTDIKLSRTAHADHVVPASRGGTDHSNNFQWLTPEANQFKGARTDEELAHYCVLILRSFKKRNLLSPPLRHAWPDTTKKKCMVEVNNIGVEQTSSEPWL